MKLGTNFLQCLALILMSCIASTAQAAVSKAVEDEIAKLETVSTGQAIVSIDEATEVAGFIRFTPGALSIASASPASVEAKTRTFLNEYASLFGLQDPDTDLLLVRESTDAFGRGRARFRQVYQGLPVLGAELTSHFNRDGQLIAVSSSTFPITDLNTTPIWRADTVTTIAHDQVARQGSVRAQAAQLTSLPAELMVFRSGLVKGVPGKNHLAYRVEVINDSRSIREFVFIDAITGKVLDQYTGIHQQLDRKVSEVALDDIVWQDSENNPDPIPAGWDGGTVQQVIDWQNEIDGASETYHLFASMTAADDNPRLSYDGADATMWTINNNPDIACPNATWDGASTNYCSRVTADDTVAHEWGHAYTEYTANLIYQWQSGALNESYSDVWGEVVDLLNGRGTDTPDTPRTAGSCSIYGNGTPKNDDSYRWLAGEDIDAIGLIGPIRDMWRPTCHGDPGKVSDVQYWCLSSDNGGVHINSGVPNHGFALLVDGGTYNGQTITGLGLTKAAHIYWESLLMLVPVSDFADQADALEASCANLVGINLPALSTDETNPGSSGQIITEEDCGQVLAIANAVELREEPVKCGFTELFENDPPERCLDRGEVQSIALTDWEAGLGGWTASRRDVANPLTFDTPDWAVTGSLPGARAGSAAFVADLDLGNCDDDDETGALMLDSPVIQIPPETPLARLSINQWMSSEFNWDGGNLKISVNGGPFGLVPASAIVVSPYNSSLFEASVQNTNPLAGEDAWTGADGGTSNGSWGQSQIILADIAEAGDQVRLRFDFGVDGCAGAVGWYVDEVELYSCSEEFSPLCGNGIIDNIEQCDDGNKNDEDGCSAMCEIEEGWQCAAAIAPADILDPGFEAGPLEGIWTETSTNFGTPICSVASCGSGGGSGASEGFFWAFFGGIDDSFAQYEESSLSQLIVIPETASELVFDFELPACDSASDYLEIRIDDNPIFSVNGSDLACGTVGYDQKIVDISSYADGNTHTVLFHSESFTENGANTNFFVDNVAIPGIPSICTSISGPEIESVPVAGSTIEFGNQVITTESPASMVEIENIGVDALELNCSITGPQADQFNLLACSSPVPPSGSTPIHISCEPQTTGLKTASLDIATNDVSEPSVSFPLTCTGVSAPQQVVTPSPVIQVIPATDPVSIDVGYAATDGNELLSGLELRMHWDSTQLVFVDLASVWASDLASADVACQADAANLDNDSATDCYVAVLWSSVDESFPGEGNTPTLLFTANFTGDLSTAASTRVNFTAGQLAPGYAFKSKSAIIEEENIGPQTLFSDSFEKP